MVNIFRKVSIKKGNNRILKILHINVRLFEGGASRIALDLHKNSNQFDFQSTFAYGYGKGGKPSIVENEANDIFCLTKRLKPLSRKHIE